MKNHKSSIIVSYQNCYRMPGLIFSDLLLQLVMLSFFFFIFHSSCSTLPADHVNNPSLLELSVGSKFSIDPSSYNQSDGYPLSTDLMFTVGMQTLDNMGIFFPILSSPSFNSSNSSHSRGFSLGFYILRAFGDSDSYALCHNGCNNVYLAVCGGLSGNTTSPALIISRILLQAGPTSSFTLVPRSTIDGFVVPVWIANVDKPIRDWAKASLGVVAAAADSNYNHILQLRDGDETVWNVSGVGMMEMEDSGDLVIFSSPSRTNVVWKSSSFSTDTLLEGQKLTVGGELRSNDSRYLARMEKGGLVLYLNNAHFMSTQPPPYWILPLLNPSLHLVDASINHFISAAPCTNSSAFAVLDHDYSLVHSRSAENILFHLDPGSCNLFNTTILVDELYNLASWSFFRLEIDGRLCSYIVRNPSGVAPSVTRLALDSDPNGLWLETPLSHDFQRAPLFSHWGQECGVPMACGPVGICTPGAKPTCICPKSYFDPINSTDITQGCKRQTSLPECGTGSGNEHINSTDFLELNSTASIFLFNGWNFSPTPGPVDTCKHLCSTNCSCHGFFYQVDISACYFITDEFTLLTVVDGNLTIVNYSTSLLSTQKITATNYVTHLKVVSLNTGSVVSLNNGSGSKSYPALQQASKSATTALILILATIMPCLVIGMACSGIYWLFRDRKRKFVQVRLQAKEEKELQDILPLLPRRFSYKVLHEATKGFSKLLGEGGFGSVYAGTLCDGRKVAVKVLQVVVKAGADQSRQFLAEVSTIGRTNHHNIVHLYGFCWELSHRLLVYEYMERGSLDRWLFDVNELEAFLDWQTRYNVALGISRGLNYLHEDCENPILHFDIKPQNILLDDDFVAKLADFGMSRLMKRDASSVVTGVRGTPGYIAPEWFSHGAVSKKSDIFSMGMVLLELVGGRKILDFSFLKYSTTTLDATEQDAWHLPSWAARKCEQGMMMELVDKRLQVCGFDGEQAQKLIHIALWCIHEDPAMRPSALTVVQWLDGIPPKRYPTFSTVVNAALKKPLPSISVYDESHIDHISMF